MHSHQFGTFGAPFHQKTSKTCRITLPFGQDYVAALESSILPDRITSLRSVFLFPTTGYLTDQSKSTSCVRRTSFFVHHCPLRERALDGPLAHKKSTQLSLSAFALVCDPDRIRTCDPQLRRLLLYPAELPDQSIFMR